MRKEHYASAQAFGNKNGLRSRPDAPSLAGKRFRLRERTLAIEVVCGNRGAVTIPAGAIIKVLPSRRAPDAIDSDGTVQVSWEGRKLETFACDVTMRGAEVP